jgi:hypothetical protein
VDNTRLGLMSFAEEGLGEGSSLYTPRFCKNRWREPKGLELRGSITVNSLVVV